MRQIPRKLIRVLLRGHLLDMVVTKGVPPYCIDVMRIFLICIVVNIFKQIAFQNQLHICVIQRYCMS